MESVITVVLAAIASSGLWTFLTFILTRKDRKKNFVTQDEMNDAIGKCAAIEEFEDLKKDTTALKENIELLKLGLQAMLRSELVHEYNKWTERGYAPIYARENFENIYSRYHSLGANGVMDDLRDKFLLLPTELSNIKDNQINEPETSKN